MSDVIGRKNEKEASKIGESGFSKEIEARRRRMFMRRECTHQVDLVGPDFSIEAVMDEISLGGFRILVPEHAEGKLITGVRVRMVLPVPTPEQWVVTGSQVSWCKDGRVGLLLMHANASSYLHQQLIDHLVLTSV